MTKTQDALNIVLKNIKRLPPQKKPLDRAVGHVLANGITAPRDLPPFNRSAMDGYAIALGDDGVEFKVIGEVSAGQVYKGKLKKGTAVRVMTGAQLPNGTAKVLMKEHVKEIEPGKIKITTDNDRINVRYRGEELRKGAKLFSPGDFISPVVLANIASLGLNAVSVYQKPKAGILVTGNELLKLGDKYVSGKIYNSNGPMLRSLLLQRGLEVASVLSAKDSRTSLKSALNKLLKRSEVVFISGGISVGDYDLVYETMQECGAKIHVSRVAVQPGKPFTFAKHKNKSIFALPGNPVSVFVTYNLFAIPALCKMMGLDYEHSVETRIFKGAFERDRTERELYLPIVSDGNDGVKAVGYRGSGDLFALSKADGLVIVPIGKSSIRDGDVVKIIRL